MTGFLFDLDGVVIDSMPLHTEAWEVYLDGHGIVVEDLVARMHGRRNDDIVQMFFGSHLSADEIHAHGAAKEKLFREMMQARLAEHLVPGVKEFLDKYADVPTGLASNAEPLNIDFVLDGAGIRGHFDVIVDGQQVARAKPFPDIYLKAAELLGVAAGDCIVFEDSPAGIQAGRGAGALVVGVRTHSGELPEVDLLIDDFQDPKLTPWLITKTSKLNLPRS
jgi:HAD superfamily hydrolase (TIGR01509 family)